MWILIPKTGCNNIIVLGEPMQYLKAGDTSIEKSTQKSKVCQFYYDS